MLAGVLTCIVDEDVQSVLGVQKLFGKCPDRIDRGQVKVPDDHVPISCGLPDLFGCLHCSGQVPARHDHPGPCSAQQTPLSSLRRIMAQP